MAKLSAEATKTAQDLKQVHGNLPQIPQIKVGEGPMADTLKEDVIERYEAVLESGGTDSFNLLAAAQNFGALDAIVELPPARGHSLSEDTVLAPKPVSKPAHSLSADELVSRPSEAAPAHSLSHDRIINAKPSGGGAHRLSADAMVPVRTAAPTGHYLDEDHTVSGPKQLFSHELLEDPRALRPAKSPQPHGLDTDRKLVSAQKPSQPHSLHNDTILPAPKARSAHDLQSDPLIASNAQDRGAHDLAHDVRILSPSGAVRDPHSIGEDFVIKNTAVFRKSPHPDAMVPGDWAASSSSGASDRNPMGSLNASLQNASQALNNLNKAVESESGKENATSTFSVLVFLLGTWTSLTWTPR